MESIIKERHSRIKSLVKSRVSSSEDMFLELPVCDNILNSLQNAIKNYILDCLYEFHSDRSFDSDLSIDAICSDYQDEIMSLPNRTPNGLMLPKQEVLCSYNAVVKHAVRLASFFGLTDTCESAYMPLNIRLPWGNPDDATTQRPHSSVKWHTDIWAGEWAQSVMLHAPIFGNFKKNGISFASPPPSFYPDYVKHLVDYNDGLGAIVDKRDYDVEMEIGKCYLVDSFLLHKTLCEESSFRGILSFPLKPKQKLSSDIYENDQRRDDFIPMNSWCEFGTKKASNNSEAPREI